MLGLGYIKPGRSCASRQRAANDIELLSRRTWLGAHWMRKEPSITEMIDDRDCAERGLSHAHLTDVIILQMNLWPTQYILRQGLERWR